MKSVVAAALSAFWLALMVAGVWMISFTLLGVVVVIIGVLGFVVTFASSLPQSTLHARDD